MSRILLLYLLLLPVVSTAQAITDFIPAKPAYARLYNDENAYAYYHSQWRKLEDKLINHHKKTGNQLVILSIATTGGYSIDEIATETFRKWGIGDKEVNTGLLVLIARKERQVRIETGYGLEGAVPDITANAIIETILKTALDSFAYVLPPQHTAKGYLPAMERAIDTLINLTKEISTPAVNNTKSTTRQRNKYGIASIVATIIAFSILLIKRRKPDKLMGIEKHNLTSANTAKRKKGRNKRTLEGQYWYPLLILLAIVGLTILWPLKWIYAIVAAILLAIRWIYYLPSPKLKAETIAFNKEWDAKRKRLKEEYREKKKILGSEKLYENFEAYMAKYFELGLDKLEKELKVGVFAARPANSKKEYDVKSLLYDIFLGTTETEKKRSFSSNSTSGYSGDSTGGQSAGDFGGGSSGGGGASS